MNLYKEPVPESEWQGLKECDFPDQVSIRLLAKSIRHQDESVLDIGCGPRAELGKQVMRFHARSYLGLDISQAAVVSQRQQGNKAMQGDATMLGLPDKQFDIVHMRLVLMHLTPPQRELAIRETLRVAKKRVYFIEADWTPFTSTGPVIKRFHDLLLATLGKKVDLSYGAKLEDDIRKESLKAHTVYNAKAPQRVRAPEVYKELIDLTKRLAGHLTGTPYEQEALSVLEELQGQLLRKECESFRPADFIAVEVLLKR